MERQGKSVIAGRDLDGLSLCESRLHGGDLPASTTATVIVLVQRGSRLEVAAVGTVVVQGGADGIGKGLASAAHGSLAAMIDSAASRKAGH